VEADAPARFVGLYPLSLDLPEVIRELALPVGVRKSLNPLAASGNALWHRKKCLLNGRSVCGRKTTTGLVSGG
jgi:hypothetical protein